MSTVAVDRYSRMLELAAELSDINSANALLGWDQETKMPKSGVEGRAHVSATMAGLAHERLTSAELGDILRALREKPADLDEIQQAQVRELWRAYSRATRIPARLVKRNAQATSRATAIWAQARRDKKFADFAPILGEVVGIQREMAEAIGYKDHPYNALLEAYEPGATIAGITPLLDEVRTFLVPFVKAIGESGRHPDLKPVLGPFDHKGQEAFSHEVIRAMGFDLDNAGRVDPSNHPFCSGIHVGDVRLTARFKDDLRIGLYGCMHEAGHGLYEQGIGGDIRRTPIGQANSLGVHESQSRMWENNVGLGLPFWTAFYPRLQKAFPAQVGGVPLDRFYAAVNDVRPSFIRIEADEVTYCLHIALRFEIEKELLTGGVAVKDLPGIWNAKFTEYFGITPPSDDLGVLQDIHWSHGLLGYFPTYTLGSLRAAQFYAAAARDIPDLDGRIAKGELLPLKDWLVENVHRHGARFLPEELMQRATGKATSAEDFVTYLKAKYVPLYGLK